jgi:hypothetical protein
MPNRLASYDTVSALFKASIAAFTLKSGACCVRFDVFDLIRGEDRQTANLS